MTSFATASFGFGGYIGTFPTLAAVRALTYKIAQRKGDFLCCGGTLSLGDGAGGIYAWVAESLENDDGQQVIKPFDLADDQPGRWRWVVKGDSALFEKVTTLISQVNDPVYGLLKLQADILSEIQVRMEGDTVSITKTDTLEAKVDGNKVATDARITDVSLVSASATKAVADRTTTLETSVNDPNTGLAKANATIIANAHAASDQTAAVASRASTLEAQFRGDVGSNVLTRIANEETARSTAIDAVVTRTSTMESQFAGATGSALLSRIQTEETTRSDQVSTLANRVTTVEANTGNGDIGARVQTLESASATYAGKLAASFQVTADAGNGRAQLSVHADNYGGSGVDIVGDVNITGNVKVSGSVVQGLPTTSINNNAVTNGDAVATNGQFVGAGQITTSLNSYSVPANAWRTMNTYVVNLSYPARLVVTANCKQAFADVSSSGNASWAGRITVNGTVIDECWGQSPQDKLTLNGFISLGAGSYTVLQQFGGNGQVSAYNPKMFLDWSYK